MKEADAEGPSGWTATRSAFVDAPVFDALPMVLECELVSYDKSDCRMVGKIVNVGIDESCCSGDKADVAKIDPVGYDPINHLYLRFGETVAKAFNIGRTLK